MSTDYTGNCPIWRTPANIQYSHDWMMRVDSPRSGGQYLIRQDISLMGFREEYDNDLVKALLTSWLIEQRLLGEKCPKIRETEIAEASERQSLSEAERADRLLKYLWRETQHTGKCFEYGRQIDQNSEHFLQMMAWSESTDRGGVDSVVNYLLEKSGIEEVTGKPNVTYRLIVDGC